jgi:hypothetical protein
VKRGVATGLVLLAHAAAGAQSAGELHLRRLLSTPVGALPPMSMLMPASRNHNYWAGRIQAGIQRESFIDHWAAAGGVDLQWRGGSVFGVTGGYRQADCGPAAPVGGDDPCPSHALFGARARFNLVTGGPTFASLVGDNSATTAVGAELGFGYAPNAMSGRNACAVDAGVPISFSMFQRIRLLTFFSPGLAWDVRCPRGGDVGAGVSTYLGAGVGLQQLGHPGLDVSLGVQRIFRHGAGIQVGLNVTFVRLPGLALEE